MSQETVKVVSFIVKANQDLCLTFNEGSDQISLAKYDGSDIQKFRMFEDGTIQQVSSGKFLTTEVKQIHITNGEAVWEGNYTKPRCEDETNDATQKWTYANEVLRHTADSRSLDIENWTYTDGNKVCVVTNHYEQTGQQFILKQHEEYQEASKPQKPESQPEVSERLISIICSKNKKLCLHVHDGAGKIVLAKIDGSPNQ